MQLSKRLQRIADFVPSGSRLVDVGCDHGYLSVDLTQKGRVKGALAMDVRPGPLEHARQNIRGYGLEAYIETRLSDGLREMPEGAGDVLVIAGMGGPLMERILTESREKAAQFSHWILQPQSDIPHFRRFVEEQGFQIAEEAAVCEDGKYYFILHALPGSAPYGEEIYYLYGKSLLLGRDPVLHRYLEKEFRKQEAIFAGLQRAGSKNALDREQELKKEREQLLAALALYDER